MKSDLLHLRAHVIKTIRDFFWERGFLEVETPLLIPANAPEEYIDPIYTLPDRQLQTSPELCMKRLLARGHPKIFQLSHCWRADERGARHLSEFTMLEWYRAGSDYTDLMNDCRELLQQVSELSRPVSKSFIRNSVKVSPFNSWQRYSVQEAFLHFGQADVLDCLGKGLYEEMLTSVIEPALAGCTAPVILMDYPTELAALARTKPGKPDLAERFELYVGGLELANGFSELNDSSEQRRRFEEANVIRRQNGKESLPLPEPFLKELAGMPPSAGIALGVDRLVMLTAGVENIDQIVAFTPEEL